MRWRILLMSVAALAFFVAFAPGASAQPIGQCNTSYSLEDSGGCGTSCPSLCDSVTTADGRRQKCLDALSSTSPWNKYELIETQEYNYIDLFYEYFYDFNPISTSVVVNRVCSTADKRDPSGNLSQLYAGMCSCTEGSPPSVGGKYKVCCQAEGDLTTATRRAIDSVRSWEEDDDYSWPEANCELPAPGRETVIDYSGSPACPQPPTMTLTGNGVSGTLTVKNGEKVDLRWTISGFDRVLSTNITGVAESPTSGSYPKNASSPPYIQFPPGTPAGATHTLWIEAADDYRGYSTPSANDVSNRSVRNRIELTLTSAGDGTPDCPIQLPKSQGTKCSDFNYYPQRTDGKKSGDGTTNDYTKDAIVFVDPEGKCKAKDDQSVGCYSANCSRCSINNPGKFSSWSTDKVDYANKACLTFNNVQYTPVSGTDARCVEPLGCVVDLWEIDPKTVSKGNSVDIKWRAKSLTPSDALGPSSCKIRQKSSKSDTEKTVAPEKAESFGPITEDTTFSLSCATDSGKTCSAGGDPAGLVKVGCEITKFVSETGIKTKDKYYETEAASASISWEVLNAESCDINDVSASISPASKSLQVGENTFKLSCKTKSAPETKCEDSIIVKRIGVSTACTIDSFTASPSKTAKPGDRSNLSWSTTNATTCSLSGGGVSATGNPRTSPYPFPVNPIETTTYTLDCNNGGCSRQATVTVTPAPAGSQIRVDPGLSVNVSSSPECLPENGTGTRYTVRYGASTINPCVGLIGGGSDSPTNVNCQVTTGNWSPSLQGSGSQTFNTISQTTTYGISCQRSTYSCSRNDQEWKSGTKTQNLANCEAARTAALNDPDVKSATCVNTGCFDYYTSANCPYEDRSSCCNSWSQCSDTYGPCVDKKPKGNCSGSGKSCSSNSDCDVAGTCGADKKCSGSGKACTSNSDCTTPGTCTNVVDIGVCQSNKSWSCQYDSSCRYSYDCKSNYSCNSFKCEIGSDGKPYEGYRLDVVSKDIVSPAVSGQTVVRYVQKPYSPSITARQDSRTITKILLNQLFDISWSVSAPDSLIPTFLSCTASGSGDPEIWRTATNGLPSSGTAKDFLGSFLSPNKSTIYSLWCRNRDQQLPNSCYNDGPSNSLEIKVYTPDLQEKGPSSFNFVEKLIGMISGAR